MINNVLDMYKSLLDGVKKDSTAIISPNQFNRIINDWGQDEWIKENALAVEFNQKQIDDLDKLRCVTDGLFQWDNNGTLITLFPLAPVSTNDKNFIIPKYVQININNRKDNGTVETQDYPQYLRMLNVSFKLTYGANQECKLTGTSDWLPASIMRSDKRSVVFDNPFRLPKDSRLYYELINGTVRLITSNASTSVGYALRLEFLRYPVSIFFDPDRATANDVNCEVGPQQQKEIVDIAVRTYLERVRDPRYQSFLNEEAIKSYSK
jgi:hypothetical protein